jgi:putative ABC transport system permease protein
LPEDLRRGPQVAVINQTMARRYWPSESPLGKRFKEVLPGLDNPWLTVTGVTADVLYNRDGQVVPMFYHAMRQWAPNGMPLVVRTAGDPLKLVTVIRGTVRSIDPAIPYFDIDTVQHGLEQLDRPRVFQTRLIALFALVALILAALGLYGLMSYAVEQRIKEIGIRVALGATSPRVIRLVLRQGLKWALAGAAAGFAGAIALGRAVSSLLFGITPADPVTLASVIAVLAAVTATACGLPARSAARVDPVAAIRQE